MAGAYDPYEKYGLKRVINAATSLTLLGGSMPHPEVFKAMEDASKAFVSIPDARARPGRGSQRYSAPRRGSRPRAP